MAPTRNGTRARNVCITLNNHTATELSAIQRFYSQHHEHLRYLVWNVETGESGTPHIQAYIEFRGQKTWSQIKNMYVDGCAPWGRAHMETRMGTSQQASDYCKKDQPFTGQELGELSRAGARSDLQAIATMIEENTPIMEVAEANPSQYILHHKGMLALRCLKIQRRNPTNEVEVDWYHGLTGTGKTRKAFEDNPNAYFWGPEQGTWWDGYDGQLCVILDEFRGQFPLGYLLRLLDRFPMKVQYKGGMVEMAAIKFVICSPLHPRDVYSAEGLHRDDRIAQLLRRITTITHFSSVVADSITGNL